MIFKCELATNIAAVTGGISPDQAYHWLIRGSTSTFCFRYTFGLVMLDPLYLLRFIRSAYRSGWPDSFNLADRRVGRHTHGHVFTSYSDVWRYQETWPQFCGQYFLSRYEAPVKERSLIAQRYQWVHFCCASRRDVASQ